ncbi:MAG: zinc ribbon domain-containing protein [Acidobacteriota bacterium]
MYCPNCGSHNQAEIKFCTRCGTNLSAVSEALTGKIKGKTDGDDRIAKLMRDYYRGRRDTITGAVLIPAALLIMTIMAAAGMNPKGAFFIICWMFFWGAAALAGGLGKWIASSTEMKALGYGSRGQFQGAHLQHSPPAAQAELPPSGYSTAPVGYPGSVTEQTTRQLDERGYAPLEREKDLSR